MNKRILCRGTCGKVLLGEFFYSLRNPFARYCWFRFLWHVLLTQRERARPLNCVFPLFISDLTPEKSALCSLRRGEFKLLLKTPGRIFTSCSRPQTDLGLVLCFALNVLGYINALEVCPGHFVFLGAKTVIKRALFFNKGAIKQYSLNEKKIELLTKCYYFSAFTTIHCSTIKYYFIILRLACFITYL